MLQPERPRRIGFLSVGPPGSQFERLRDELGKLGYVEGRSVTFEYRFAPPSEFSQLPDRAAELVGLGVELIVVNGLAPAQAARRATATIPIVLLSVGNAIESGLVASLPRPGGNVTGLAGLVVELGPKTLELLKEAFPSLARPALLWTSLTAGVEQQAHAMQAAARSLGLDLQPMDVRDVDGIQRAIPAFVDQGADGIVVVRHALFTTHREQLLASVTRAGLPAIYAQRELVEAGGLMAYVVNQTEDGRRVATYVDKILKGAKPAELPVEQPSKFDLVVNLRTARALGFTLTRSILQQATEVIE